MTTPDTPAVTESLRERLIEAAGFGIEAEMQDGILDGSLQLGDTKAGRIFAQLAVQACWPIVEKVARLHAEEKARLVGEFRRLAAEANKPDASRQPFDCGWDQGEESAWNQAAQMLEESKP